MLYEECEKDFENRIKSYKPVVILNGCTSSGDKKKWVKDTIDKMNKNKTIQTFAISHPVSWQNLVETW